MFSPIRLSNNNCYCIYSRFVMKLSLNPKPESILDIIISFSHIICILPPLRGVYYRDK